MNKILLILQREYLTRVMKKSFWIWTLVLPFIIAGSFSGMIWMMDETNELVYIQVIDETNLLNKLKNTEKILFEYTSATISNAKNSLGHASYNGTLHITTDVLEKSNAKIYFDNQLGYLTQQSIRHQLEEAVEEYKLSISKIDSAVYYDIWSRINLDGISLSNDGDEMAQNAGNTFLGVIMAFLMYIFVMLYSIQVMRGVLEDKTSRIVEVIVSSVKPIQLMAGKISGIALVGLTQFFLWTLLTFVASSIFQYLLLDTPSTMEVSEAMNALDMGGFNFDPGHIMFIASIFIFFFLGGYLLYSALYAAIGSMIESESESQQFMVPVSFPLIVAIIAIQFSIENPDNTFVKWLSYIPFTSPIVMMSRISQGVETYEILLSMLILMVTVVGTTWLAAKIFRTGILMYGKKASYKEVWKWLFYN